MYFWEKLQILRFSLVSGRTITDFPSLINYGASVVSRVAFLCTFYRIILCWATRLTKPTVLMTKMPKGGEQWTSLTQTDLWWRAKLDFMPRSASKDCSLPHVLQRIIWLSDKEESNFRNALHHYLMINKLVPRCQQGWKKNFQTKNFALQFLSICYHLYFNFVSCLKGWFLIFFGMKIGGVRVAKKTPLSLNKWVHG